MCTSDQKSANRCTAVQMWRLGFVVSVSEVYCKRTTHVHGSNQLVQDIEICFAMLNVYLCLAFPFHQTHFLLHFVGFELTTSRFQINQPLARYAFFTSTRPCKTVALIPMPKVRSSQNPSNKGPNCSSQVTDPRCICFRLHCEQHISQSHKSISTLQNYLTFQYPLTNSSGHNLSQHNTSRV